MNRIEQTLAALQEKMKRHLLHTLQPDCRIIQRQKNL